MTQRHAASPRPLLGKLRGFSEQVPHGNGVSLYATRARWHGAGRSKGSPLNGTGRCSLGRAGTGSVGLAGGAGLVKALSSTFGVVVLVPLLFLGGVIVAATTAMSGALAPSSATDVARQQIPASMLDVDAAAADACPGLPWQLIAAVGSTEDPDLATQLDPRTGEIHPPYVGPLLNGQGGEPSVADRSEPSGWAHAEGPFHLLTTTWAADATVPPGSGRSEPDPQNAWDSAFTFDRALCGYLSQHNGDVGAALAAYDAGPVWDQGVLALALAYGMAPGASGAPAGSGGSGSVAVPSPGVTYQGQIAVVIAAAESQLGVAYRWGAESPGRGFDCSGLLQWAYGQAGVALPRTTYVQATVGVEVSRPWSSTVEPGDLLLMPGIDNGITTPLGHIAMAIGGGLMIQAPYTGTVVQIDPIPWSAIELVRRVVT